MITICSLLLFCLSCYLCDERVKYVALVFRHGDRTPVDPYPTDPWRNESLWPVPFGQLTNIGKMQHFKLGQWLRKRYSHLISEKFDPSEVYIRSTDVDRTLMSAQANLAGLYPPVGNAIWNPDLMWQPIPIHTVPEKEDKVLAMKQPCPAYDQELKKLVNSKPYKDRLNKYRKLMDYLSTKVGMNVSDYYDIDSIYSVLNIEKFYNFTLPDWTKTVFPDQMIEPSGYSFKVNTFNPFLARVKIGPLLKELTEHATAAIIARIKAKSGPNEKYIKLSMYSGHDLTVGSVLNGLGLYDGYCPNYASTIFFEILEDEKTPPKYFVRISYRNTPELVEPLVLNIPHCGELCPFERFLKIYDNIINVNWEHDCGFHYHPPLTLSLIVGLLLFCMIYVAHKLHFARVSRQYSDPMISRQLALQLIQRARKGSKQNCIDPGPGRPASRPSRCEGRPPTTRFGLDTSGTIGSETSETRDRVCGLAEYVCRASKLGVSADEAASQVRARPLPADLYALAYETPQKLALELTKSILYENAESLSIASIRRVDSLDPNSLWNNKPQQYFESMNYGAGENEPNVRENRDYDTDSLAP